jgi:hypothetical protein
VHVELGARRFDVTHRAVVVAADEAADVVLGRDVEEADLVALGDLYVPAPGPDVDPDTALARQALAITRGARVVGTRDVRRTRRVADVLAAILSRT